MPAFASLIPDSSRDWAPRAHRPRTSLVERIHNAVGPVFGAPHRCTRPDPLAGIEWPEEHTIEALGKAIAAAHGLEIIVMPIPEEMRHQEISGLTTVTGRTAYVFYDAELSPLNREQTILHEYAHILHGDVRADSDCTHLRSMFDDPIEKRAETTGMRLLEAMHRKQRARAHQQGSEVLSFFSGADGVSGH
jgi:hypothetical protein